MFNSMIAGIAGGVLAVAAAKVLTLVATKLKLIPEWIEGRTGWHTPEALHNAFDTAVDIGVQAANAFRTPAFWKTAVNLFRKNKSEEALQAFLGVLYDAVKAGAKSIQLPPEWQSVWDELRRDVATKVATDDLTPRMSLMAPEDTAKVKAVLASPTVMAPVLAASVSVDKHGGGLGPLSDQGAAEVKKTIEQLIAESKARQLTLAK